MSISLLLPFLLWIKVRHFIPYWKVC